MRRAITWQLWALLWSGAAFAGTAIKPSLSLTAEERYDDDALLRGTTGPLGAELMTKLTPRLGLGLRGRTYDAEGWYASDFQFRHLSKSFHLDHRGGLQLHKRLSPQDSVLARLQLWAVSDPTSLPRMGMGRTLAPVVYGTGELGYDSALTRRWLLNARYAFEGAYFFDGLTPPGAVHAPSLDLWYRATRRASVGVGYRFQHFLFGQAQGIAHSPTAMFRYRLSPFTTFTARGGPAWFQSSQAEGIAPRVHVELARDARGLEMGFQLGQDLAGASGYTLALWAQYAGGYVGWRLSERLRIFGGTFGFRNGTAPGGPSEWFGGMSEYGYAVSGGLEWRFDRRLMLQLQVDRIEQMVGAEALGTFARNIAALRLVMTAW
jgi:hypothetical protein